MGRQIVVLIQTWGGSEQRKDQNNYLKCFSIQGCTLNQEEKCCHEGTAHREKRQDLRLWKSQQRSKNKHQKWENRRLDSGACDIEVMIQRRQEAIRKVLVLALTLCIWSVGGQAEQIERLQAKLHLQRRSIFKKAHQIPLKCTSKEGRGTCKAPWGQEGPHRLCLCILLFMWYFVHSTCFFFSF